MDVALVGEQVLGLAQRFGTRKRRCKMRARFRRAAGSQLPSPEGEPSSHILSERQTLPALPGLEAAADQDIQGLVVSADLVQQRAKLDREIVALIDEDLMLAQLSQPIAGKATESPPELIAFVEQSRVVGRGGERPFIIVRGLDRIIADVERADAEIAPHDRNVGSSAADIRQQAIASS